MTDPADVMELPQGDIRLLQSRVATHLLASRELARVAYIARDGTPRVFPMLFHWTGDELVLCTFAGARKITAIRANPSAAVTIDAATTPPTVMLLRGRATVREGDGILPEYRLAHRRYAGQQQGDANVAAVDHPGVRMARIGLRPARVGLLDFVTRMPGGVSAEDFDKRGR